MSSERQSRIGLLSRTSKGRAVLPGYLAALSRVTDSEVTATMLTGLEERDSLLELFRIGYQNTRDSGTIGFSKTYRAGSEQVAFNLVRCLGDQLNEVVFLITKESETCGAVCLPAVHAFRNSEALVALDGDALMALSKDHSQGLLLDLIVDQPQSRYELAIWGDRWSMIALNCDR